MLFDCPFILYWFFVCLSMPLFLFSHLFTSISAELNYLNELRRTIERRTRRKTNQTRNIQKNIENRNGKSWHYYQFLSCSFVSLIANEDVPFSCLKNDNQKWKEHKLIFLHDPRCIVKYIKTRYFCKDAHATNVSLFTGWHHEGVAQRFFLLLSFLFLLLYCHFSLLDKLIRCQWECGCRLRAGMRVIRMAPKTGLNPAYKNPASKLASKRHLKEKDGNNLQTPGRERKCACVSTRF